MTIEEIKKSIDLADHVRSCGIELKKHGKNDLVGLCPFHQETKPSFIVNPIKNLFNCFGCGKGGSVIDFVMLRENVELKQAIEILSDYLNTNKTNKAPPAEESAVVPQERRDNGGTGKKKTLTPERSNQLLEKVISFYEKTFADVPEGRKYLECRGITDAGLYSSHRIGYCNGTLPKILPRNGTIHDELKELGILFENGNERFTGCIVIPVFDIERNILTLYSRYTGNHPAKNHMFLPDRSKGIWNISAIKTYPKIILVESIIDGLSVKMAGYHNVIAISGNNSFQERRSSVIQRTRCSADYFPFRWG